MPTFRVSVYVEVDDVPLANFPIVRRITTADAQPLRTVRGVSGGFVALPSGEMTSIAVAMLQATGPLQVAFNGVTTAPITLNATGMLILVDAALSAVAVQNSGGSSAQVAALLAGT
jgi:hypothetical protein